MEQEIIDTSIQLLLPVIESAMVIAGNYAKSCGRDIVTSLDTQYAMKYCAMNIVGKQIGTLFPELQGSDSEDSEDSEGEDEEECPFTRYTGDDQLLNDVNKAFDTWDTWEPSNITESMLKNAINKSY